MAPKGKSAAKTGLRAASRAQQDDAARARNEVERNMAKLARDARERALPPAPKKIHHSATQEINSVAKFIKNRDTPSISMDSQGKL